MRIERSSRGWTPPSTSGDQDRTPSESFSKRESPPVAGRRRRFTDGPSLRAPTADRRASRGDARWVAPGVRLMSNEAEPPADAPPPATRAARRRRRQVARRDPPAIATVEPSRPSRTELIPARGPVVAPRRIEGLDGAELVNAIRTRGQMTRHLGYRPAREAMFRFIDNDDGIVEGVYTGRKVRTDRIPSADGNDGMNTEHAWPQSKGVRGIPARYDLHHLFPTNAYANGRRGSFPFGVVTRRVRWEEGGSKLGFDNRGNVVFEPRPGMRGDVARALFYISAMYGLEIPQAEEDTLRRWNAEEPPDPAEIARNDEISRFQGNRNPFVDQPDLADRIARFSD